MLRELRFIAGLPFGFMAELFARLAIAISGNQANVDFNYIARRECMTFKYSSRMCEYGTKGCEVRHVKDA
jgi:hypothetical protein